MKNLNTISYIVECVPYSSFPFFCLYIISVHSIVNLYSFKFIFSINFVADLSRVFYMIVSTAFHYIGDVFFFFFRHGFIQMFVLDTYLLTISIL